MERKTWSVHFDMETSEKSVQNTGFSAQKEPKRKRRQADKVGKLKVPSRQGIRNQTAM